MGATTLRITTFSITALSIKGLYVTLSINDTQQSLYADFHYTEFAFNSLVF
jgi:hypothetical protein